MKKTIFVSASVAAAALTFGAVAPALADGPEATNIDEIMPLLAAPQHAEDAFSGTSDLKELGGVDESSVRALGEDETASFWVGRNGSGDMCLITSLKHDERFTSTVCTSFVNFQKHGLGVTMGEAENDDHSTEAYLFPADIVPEDDSLLQARSLTSENAFVSGKPSEVNVKPFTVERSGGDDFAFTPLDTEVN